MEIVTIDAAPFFTKVRDNNKSMWDMLALLIDGKQKLIRFVDENNQLLLQYVLPTTVEELKENQKEFATMLKKSLDDDRKAQQN